MKKDGVEPSFNGRKVLNHNQFLKYELRESISFHVS